jgi:hypothetical protein
MSQTTSIRNIEGVKKYIYIFNSNILLFLLDKTMDDLIAKVVSKLQRHIGEKFNKKHRNRLEWCLSDKKEFKKTLIRKLL